MKFGRVLMIIIKETFVLYFTISLAQSVVESQEI